LDLRSGRRFVPYRLPLTVLSGSVGPYLVGYQLAGGGVHRDHERRHPLLGLREAEPGELRLRLGGVVAALRDHCGRDTRLLQEHPAVMWTLQTLPERIVQATNEIAGVSVRSLPYPSISRAAVRPPVYHWPALVLPNDAPGLQQEPFKLAAVHADASLSDANCRQLAALDQLVCPGTRQAKKLRRLRHP
jgi:hypothetical protein